MAASLSLAAVSGKWLDLTRPAEPSALAKPRPSLSFVHPETFETRLEAPLMTEKKGASVDALALERLEGPLVVIDAQPWCATRRDCQVRREDLLDFERLHGRIAPGAIVLIQTGFARYWGERARYLGFDEEKKDSKLHFPGLHPTAAAWLAENRKPKLVGIDGPSVDYGPSKLYETHRALFARNIPVIENAAGLEALPRAGAFAVALPAKLKGASSAPARLAAVLEPVR